MPKNSSIWNRLNWPQHLRPIFFPTRIGVDIPLQWELELVIVSRCLDGLATAKDVPVVRYFPRRHSGSICFCVPDLDPDTQNPNCHSSSQDDDNHQPCRSFNLIGDFWQFKAWEIVFNSGKAWPSLLLFLSIIQPFLVLKFKLWFSQYFDSFQLRCFYFLFVWPAGKLCYWLYLS